MIENKMDGNLLLRFVLPRDFELDSSNWYLPSSDFAEVGPNGALLT